MLAAELSARSPPHPPTSWSQWFGPQPGRTDGVDHLRSGL